MIAFTQASASEIEHASPGSARLPVGAFLIVVGVVALVTRFVILGRKSIWLDEAWSWRSASIPLREMLDATAADNHPPLYYAVLHAVVKIFGDSEVALRAPSAVAGAATILLLAFVAWRTGGLVPAAIAAILLTLNGAFLGISQEARMYALVSLLALAASAVIGEYLVRRSRALIALYAALAICLIYADYSGFIVIALDMTLLLAYGIVGLRRERRADVLVDGAVALAAIALAFAPWSKVFAEQLGVGAPLSKPDAELVRSVLRYGLGLESAGVLWLPLAAILLGAGAYGVARRIGDPRIVAIAALALVPLGQLVISLAVTPVFALRQVAPYIPGLLFVAALGLDELRLLVTRLPAHATIAVPAISVLATLVVAMTSVGLLDQYRAPSLEDWRGAAGEARAGGDVVYLWRRYTDLPATYYLRPPADIRRLASSDAASVDAEFARPGANRSGTIILSHESPNEAQSILAAFSAHAAIAPSRHSYEGLRLYHFATR